VTDTRAADEHFMRVALEAATAGRITARPNPMVGAAIVREGALVATGFHERVGGPHAEVVALRAAGELARGATVYVNLEPCSHHGRTPPCADALVAAGVGRVVAGMVDPNPRVSGRGLQRLRDAGIEVEVGVLEAECRALNEDFLVAMTLGRPFVTLKLAVSIDGRIADAAGRSQWISSPGARQRGQLLRAESDAVLVGTGTLRADNPRLTVRDLVPIRPPQRWALDPRLEIPDDAAMLDGAAPTVLVHGPDAAPAPLAALPRPGVELLQVPLGNGGRIDLRALLSQMGARGMLRVLVEGGGGLAGGLIEADLVDRIVVFVAPIVLGQAARPAFVLTETPDIASLSALGPMRVEEVDGNAMLTIDVARSNALPQS
jgi:diaminohydroxyphosphoribosylaminopyrimidine deaminase/5-amino-6-(5-phosphoribosylamino)uracil reductase